MHNIETLIGLMAAVVALVALAGRLKVPYPILLVLGGLALGFVPGLPPVRMDPELVLLVFLPPLLYSEAWFTSWRDFRANLRPILLLSVGLVAFTTGAVAAAAHALIPGVPWAVACVLGAVVAPTDTVAAGVIVARLRVPGRVVTVLEGESLVNDASSLVLYGLALGAARTGTFSAWGGAEQFALVSVGGIALGLALGWLCSWLFGLLTRLGDSSVANTAGLLAPFVAYLPAERLHVSGVLAVVAAGLYVGRQEARVLSAEVRLQAMGFWQTLTFLLNGLLFILVGLQLKGIMASLAALPLPTLLLDGLLVSLTVIAVRILWVFPATYLPRLLIPAIGRHDPPPPWQLPAVIGWTGIRGGISLAAALAVPLDFPRRDLILFLTFAVILTTLVVQGLSLPALIARLGLGDDGRADAEETHARLRTSQVALDRLGRYEDDGVPPALLDSLRGHYEAQISRFCAIQGAGDDSDGIEQSAQSYLRLKRDLIQAQREAVIALRDGGEIGDAVLHRVENDLDLEEQRISP